MYKKASSKVNYQEITDKIIDLMEGGILPMGSQWSSDRYKMLPFNLATGKMYRGMNIMNLWVHEQTKGYKSNGWITINQMRTIATEDELDEPIRLRTLPDDEPGRAPNKTGQRGVPVFHGDNFIPGEWKLQETSDDTEVWRSERTGDYAGRSQISRSYLKCVGKVFNLDQIENLPDKYKVFDELRPLEEREPEITAMTDSYGIPINLSPDGGCYYVPAKHEIFLVHQDLFKTPEDFERVKFHELCHSTGHPTLLARRKDTDEKRTRDEYAFEELIAELGAAFMCAHFGIPGLMVHAEYIEHYIKVLKKDNKAIFSAAAKAQAAVELLMSHSPKEANHGNPKSPDFKSKAFQYQSEEGQNKPAKHGRAGGVDQSDRRNTSPDSP
jgi:antirestriction protein ArdC